MLHGVNINIQTQPRFLSLGVTTFISQTWGGRVSDKLLTVNSGFLNKLLPGDVVLADRGFDIDEDVARMQATLKIPAITRGCLQ